MDYKICGVYDAEMKKEDEKEKYFFKLIDCSNNVVLNVVNQYGDCKASILMISKKTGNVTRIECVTDRIGFDLTWDGMVKVE